MVVPHQPPKHLPSLPLGRLFVLLVQLQLVLSGAYDFRLYFIDVAAYHFLWQGSPLQLVLPTYNPPHTLRPSCSLLSHS